MKRGFPGAARLLRYLTLAWWFMAASQPVSAQECETYVWPDAAIVWDFGPNSDNYYVPRNISLLGGHVITTCPHSPPTCCDPVDVSGTLSVDGTLVGTFGGQPPVGHALPSGLSEGVHNAAMSATLHSAVSGEDRQLPVSTKEFCVDDTPPGISLNLQDGVILSTTALQFSAEVSDADAKIGTIWTGFSVSSGDCRLRKTPEADPAWNIEWTYCNIQNERGDCPSVIGTHSTVPLTYELNNYIVYPETGDCGFSAGVSAADRVHNSSFTAISFIVDRTPPEIHITTWPALASVPSPAIAGTAADRAGIKSVSLEIAQMNWRGTTTYWNGIDWTTAPALIALEIPPGTTSLAWTYGGLNDRNIISGSNYRIRGHATDEVDHAGVVAREFHYNACPYAYEKVPLPETEKKFEVADAVFRTKDDFLLGSFLGLNHAGVYIVSDSNYQKGESTATFVQKLSGNQGRLLPVENSDLAHYIVHARPPAVRSDSFAGFTIRPEKFRGARTAKEKLDADTRDRIAWNAAMQLGKPYTVWNNWAGGPPEDPNASVRDNPLGFRCDGHVIYSYVKAEVFSLLPPDPHGPIGWLATGPNRLSGRYMAPSIVDLPAVQRLSVDAGETGFSISLEAGDESSGLDQVEHFLYSNVSGYLTQQVLSKDDNDSFASQVRVSPCACNPGTNLVTRLVDRAGNWSLYDSALGRIVEESGPGTYSESLPEDKNPVIATPVIRTENSYLVMNLPSITDDITPTSEIPLFYMLDRPFHEWDDDRRTAAVHSGLADGNFVVPPGTHTLYLAAMDESISFSTATKVFTVPGHMYASAGPARISFKKAGFLLEDLIALRSVSVNDYPPGELPQGYSHLPQPLSKDVTMDADYTGGFLAALRYADHGVSAEQEPYLRLLHDGQDITEGVDRVNKVIFGYSMTASPFVVAIGGQITPDAAAPDLWPPSTEIDTEGKIYEDGQGRLYISTAAAITLQAQDDRSGAAIDTYYTTALTEALFETGLVPGSLGQFVHYSSGFMLSEGVRRLGYGSVDAAGNYELLRDATAYADGTPPKTAASVLGQAIESGTTVQIGLSDQIALSAVDPVSNGVASGYSGIYYLVDITLEECPAEPTFTGPPGTCENPAYAGPFTLPAGEHVVYYTAEDNVGNMAPIRSVFLSVSGAPVPQASIAPSSGPIGLPFTITGEGFGTYSAGTTVVVIGDAAAPLTLWSTDTIKGTIPGSLTAGEYPVAVMRGAELLAETSSFTVVIPALAEIAPSSGPIGLPFTLTGSGFGNYVTNYTRVLIGGATCPLTLWTDTQIKGTIPGAIAPGAHEVVVERALNGGLARSAAVAFDLRGMEADWIAPSSGPIGMPFTINGSGFGNYLANYTTVLMGGATCPLTLWTDTQIKGTVPGGLATGQYPVLVERKTADGGIMHSPAMSFTVLAVDASSMTPVAGPIGMPFTIYGTGFGNYSAGWTRVLIGGTTAPLTLWSDSQIKGTIPGIIAPGAYEVVVERELNGGLVASQPLPFTLTTPDLAAVAPSSGPIGLPFTLTGSGFGNYVANYTRVLIGGGTCPLTLWTDTQIKGTVPGTIAPGAHEVLVERAFNGGVARSQVLSFGLADPVLAAVSPSPAAVLAPFTLAGYNFGNYAAGRSEALIGGATAQLTLWTDTQIKGKLPALGAGEYPVLVRRSFNGGRAQSQTSTMTIVEPAVSSMTPASGRPGTTFSVFGAGFGPYDATIARVLIGGLPSALSLWNDGRINGTVPAELAVGTHTVIVSRGQYQSGALEFYMPGGGYNPAFMAPLSPSAAFRLGEVYVYPNPAKGGAVPVFHLEFGLVDKVELKVYSVAGSLVHERTLTGPPQVTAPVYAYEYAWDGHIASGVYYFTVEAERAGAKLKARGKFAVVR